MAYAFYQNHAGRECGYGFEATCDHPGCEARIDRGYAYLCGGSGRIRSPEGPGCGGYFCNEHRGFVGVLKREDEGGMETVSLCDACKADPRSLAYLKDEDEEGRQ